MAEGAMIDGEVFISLIKRNKSLYIYKHPIMFHLKLFWHVSHQDQG